MLFDGLQSNAKGLFGSFGLWDLSLTTLYNLVAHVRCRCHQFWGQYVVLGDMSTTSRQILAQYLVTLPHFGPQQCHVVLVGCQHVGFTYVGTSTKSIIVLTYTVYTGR